MKRGFILLSILLLVFMIFISGCSIIDKGAIGQKISNTKVLTDAEVQELRANYNFEAIGEVQTNTDSQGRDVSIQQFNLVPKNDESAIMGISVSCTRDGCNNIACRDGCMPQTASCSPCSCDAWSVCSGSCTCAETFTKTD